MSETTATLPATQAGDTEPSRRRFFAQPLPPGYAAENASRLREPLSERDRFTASMLLFRIGGFRLALPTRNILAIDLMRPVCSIPHRRNTALLGLVAHHGTIVPACSLSRILGAADRAGGPDARLLFLSGDRKEGWALPVDAVLRVSTGWIDNDTAHPPTTGPGDGDHAFLEPPWTQQRFTDSRGEATQVLHMPTLLSRLARTLS